MVASWWGEGDGGNQRRGREEGRGGEEEWA